MNFPESSKIWTINSISWSTSTKSQIYRHILSSPLCYARRALFDRYLIAIWSLSDHFREPLGLAHPGVVGCNRHWPLYTERLPLFKVRIPVLRLGIHVDGFHAFAISMQYDLLRSHKTMLEIKNVNHVWKMHM
jgi:hypothetical protein